MTSNGKHRVRQHSPEWVEETIWRMVSEHGFRCVYFDDDTFNLGDRHVLGICAAMRRIRLPWSAMCRADGIKSDTWREMKASGCFGVKLGFESGSQWVLDNIIHKQLDLKEATETVRLLKQIGIKVHGTFALGAPGETAAQMQETRRYRENLGLDSYQESGIAEIEGTPLHAMRARGELTGVVEADGLRKREDMVADAP